ncbi:uncharacterized protein K452DRAFT_126307 [Aplosporella prunicola CBS 121167]|uniref:Uncharacterized protein n=1 Tax=Aplosporella prunicola CBS 121167 TaxID=1176127 RepID=A0A6A6BRC8_9PEZI|nr:uncharacterized protein K452DRAFT_126307 [Aplosporella prunicola CBS 121167]KAF2145855.1 hypothetical protein K452DRAFT_126307 [Aplosporella prunicola CBS 121167]
MRSLGQLSCFFFSFSTAERQHAFQSHQPTDSIFPFYFSPLHPLLRESSHNSGRRSTRSDHAFASMATPMRWMAETRWGCPVTGSANWEERSLRLRLLRALVLRGCCVSSSVAFVCVRGRYVVGRLGVTSYNDD